MYTKREDKRPVGVGVIGWGNFFSHVHEQTLRELEGRGECRVVRVCDASEERLAEVKGRFPGAAMTREVEDVMGDEEVEALLIGAPHAVQAGLALRGAGAGKWVYVEKPMFAEAGDDGRTAEEYLAGLRGLGEKGERVAVGFNKRFSPAYQDVRGLIRRHGGAQHIQMTIVDDAWRWGARHEAGFLLWLDACHWLDLACWWMGSGIARVSCLPAKSENWVVAMQMENGASCSLFLSGDGTMDMLKEEVLVVTKERVSLRCRDFVELEVFGGAEREVRRYEGFVQSGGDAGLVKRIGAGGAAEFGRIRREMMERRRAGVGTGDGGEEMYLKRNLPNFMRDQGWRGALGAFLGGVRTGKRHEDLPMFEEGYRAYQGLKGLQRSMAAGGDFVEVGG